MEVGIRMSHLQRNDWPAFRYLALQADQAGFDSVWVADHLQGVPDREMGFLEGWTLLAAIGALTTKIHVGMSINCSLRHPGLLARMTTTLDIATGGRLRVLLTTGYWEPEFHAFGYEFSSAKQRVDELTEAVQILRGLWDADGQPFSFAGTHFVINDAVNLPSPTRAIPLSIGGIGDRMLRLAAQRADEWSCPSNMLHSYPALVEKMNALVAHYRRPLRRVVSVVFRPGQRVDDDVLGDIGGSPDQMVDKVGRLAALGVHDLNGLLSDPSTLDAVADILPQLRPIHPADPS